MPSDLNGKPVPKKAMLQMPSITKANVDKYYDQLFDHADKFVEGLPDAARRPTRSPARRARALDRPHRDGKKRMMADTVDLRAAGPILADMVRAIVKNVAMLNELDGATGDDDHGVNMIKGFRRFRPNGVCSST